MKNFWIILIGVFASAAASWAGLVLFSHRQYIESGIVYPTAMDEPDEETGLLPLGTQLYPRIPGAGERQGQIIYTEMGCVACHTQQVRRPGYGSDHAREWGARQSVARDYIRQERVLIGYNRTGPDLTNIGERIYDRNWHHQHLFNPRSVSPGSTMPPYHFLYKEQEIEGEPSDNAIEFAPEHAPKPGTEIVPTPRAEALVNYLLSLRLDYDLPEAQRLEE